MAGDGVDAARLFGRLVPQTEPNARGVQHSRADHETQTIQHRVLALGKFRAVGVTVKDCEDSHEDNRSRQRRFDFA